MAGAETQCKLQGAIGVWGRAGTQRKAKKSPGDEAGGGESRG